jgi:PiT family inorganic phosphate transporter
MGVIALALIANGNLAAGADPPVWVIVSAATAIALGTYSGGWRIIRTMGTKIIKMDAAQGFSAQGAGAAVILASSHFGFPLSTTQVAPGPESGCRRSAGVWPATSSPPGC